MTTMSKWKPKSTEEYLRMQASIEKERAFEFRQMLNESYGVIEKKDDEINQLKDIIADKNCRIAELEDELHDNG